MIGTITFTPIAPLPVLYYESAQKGTKFILKSVDGKKNWQLYGTVVLFLTKIDLRSFDKHAVLYLLFFIICRAAAVHIAALYLLYTTRVTRKTIDYRGGIVYIIKPSTVIVCEVDSV